MTPVIVTAALFIALIILDLLRHDYQLLPGHSFFGIFCVLAMGILTQNGYEYTAWGLFMIPFVILSIGWVLEFIEYDARLKPYPTKLNPTPMAELNLNIR